MTPETSKYLRLAYEHASQKSDDPRTQIGAVIKSEISEQIAYGTNRIPPGVLKLEHRKSPENKPDFIGHAERNAVAQAASIGLRTKGATMYAPWAACTVCAQAVIEAEIAELVVHKQIMDLTPEKWIKSIENAMTMFSEAGILVVYHDDPNLEMGILFNGERI